MGPVDQAGHKAHFRLFCWGLSESMSGPAAEGNGE
jgi:hypothetical protein